MPRALAILLLGAACDGDPSIDATGLASTDAVLGAALVASDPVAPATPSGSLSSRSASRAGAPAATVSFVSLPPGTVSDGVGATIRNRRTGEGADVPLVDGGFDPIAIPAVVGDTLGVAVLLASGGTVTGLTIVAARRPPRVVRTRPPRGQTDVAVNTSIVAVFSEPIAEASVGSASFYLLAPAGPVAGTARVVPGSRHVVEFTPDAPLAPLTAHTLVVERTIADLAGDVVGTSVIVPFVTGASAAVDDVVASIGIEPSVIIVLRPRDWIQLTAVVQNAAYKPLLGRTVVWTSDRPQFATVSAAGVVTAVGDSGLVSITAECEGKSATVVIGLEKGSEQVVVTTITTGVDLDPDGYLAGVMGQPVAIGLNATAALDTRGGAIWLADVDPNCSVATESYELHALSRPAASVTFTVTCQSRSAMRTDALVGVWRAERYEFFRDAALTSRIMDMIADGVEGRLTVRRIDDSEVRWEWREQYAWKGPDRPMLVGGRAEVRGDTLHTVAIDRFAGEFECDYGSCEGSLPARHVFVREGDRLVFASLVPVNAFAPPVSWGRAWLRLTLTKVR